MCGIIGVSEHPKAAQFAYIGLFALQHRGQEAAGIVSADAGKLHARTALGLVAEAFPQERLDALKGRSAVGHVRYPTAGDGDLKNAQPLVFDHVHGPIAVAHNGTLTNALKLRRQLEAEGAIFRTTTDSEVVVHLIARRKGPIERAVMDSLKELQGAYSFLFLTPEKTIAARDPLGFRPLCVGRLGKSFVFASETTALNQMGAEFLRELEPGEVVVAEGSRLKSYKPFGEAKKSAFCVFEQIYFARPDSALMGLSVQATRRALGKQLAREMKGVSADIVVAVPDSGVPAAMGFSEQSGISFEVGLVRSHYIGRTFIQPAQVLRDNAVRLKLSPVREILKGKRIILVDDSIVRGTTSRRICRMLRSAGVKEIHLAISSPPIVSPCYYGIDTPSSAELIASSKTPEQTAHYLGVDSLHYLSLDGMLTVTGGGKLRPDTFCSACFTKKYPTPLADFTVGESARCISTKTMNR